MPNYKNDRIPETLKRKARRYIGAASADGVSWNELKDKPFYLEKQLVLELTKDDFGLDEGLPFYTSSPKLDWMTSIDDVSIELKIVQNDGTSYAITENSAGIYFKTVQNDDGSEYVNFGDDKYFDIYSGREDSFSIKIWRSYEIVTEIHLKLYRKSVKKIPGTLVDAAIGKTALTVGGNPDDAVEVPEVKIPVTPNLMDETAVFYDTESNVLRISGKIMPWNGSCKIRFTDSVPTVVGHSMSFSLKEGDSAWKVLDHDGNCYNEISFHFIGSSTTLSFIVKRGGERTVTALGSNENEHVYFLSYTYGANWTEINGFIKCII